MTPLTDDPITRDLEAIRLAAMYSPEAIRSMRYTVLHHVNERRAERRTHIRKALNQSALAFAVTLRRAEGLAQQQPRKAA